MKNAVHGETKNMVLLIDNNVMIDAITAREPFWTDSSRVIKLCAEKKIQGYLAATSVADAFYILRKDYSSQERRSILLYYANILSVVGVDEKVVLNALKNENFRDFEDCLQAECAKAVGAEYIVTRNTEDFSESPVPAVTPAAILKILEEKT